MKKIKIVILISIIITLTGCIKYEPKSEGEALQYTTSMRIYKMNKETDFQKHSYGKAVATINDNDSVWQLENALIDAEFLEDISDTEKPEYVIEIINSARYSEFRVYYFLSLSKNKKHAVVAQANYEQILYTISEDATKTLKKLIYK